MMVLGVMRVKTATFLTVNQKANAKKSLWSQVTNCSSNYLTYTIDGEIARFGFKIYKQMNFYFQPVFMSMQVFQNKLLDVKAAKKTDIP